MTLEAQIRKRYGNFQLDVSFTAASGFPLALLGASGCGKSVTLRCLAGIDTPDSGTIVLDGQVLFDSEKRINLPPQKRKIGYLFQQYALFPNMTVEQNIAASLHQKDKSQRSKRVAELVKAFRLEGKEPLLPRQLSGGQQQRTALARILASEPKVILLDEPLSALDSYLKWQLELELRDVLDQFGGPVVWVSHDQGEVYRSCQRVCVMNAGKSSAVTGFPDLLADPVTASAARICGCGNFTAAAPGPEPNTVALPQWKLVLRSASPWREGVTQFGVREQDVRPAAEAAPNVFPCKILRVIEDVEAFTLVLTPTGASPDAPYLRASVRKENWTNPPQNQLILVEIRPEDILLLEE